MASMGRRMMGRLLAGGGLALLGVATVVADEAAALADNDLTQVTISSLELANEVVVLHEDRPELCTSLYREVDWLVGGDGDAREPEDPETLGAQYTMIVYIDGDARHEFHLYPLAEGGPKAFRPADQPGDRNVDEAWFHARLSMPRTLSAAGVPVTGMPVPSGGGSGGGGPAPEESEVPEDRPVLGFLEEWRQGMLLTGAVVVAIVLGLGGLSFLIRRKV
jgi:hypothetical protein